MQTQGEDAGDAPSTTRHVVVMGVSGSGKTTVAQALAEATGLPFAEADTFHSDANVAKMRGGVPLDDDDRLPWLRALAAWMASEAERGSSTVTACSALRRAYRDVLRNGPPSVSFVHLDGPAEVLQERLAARTGHFMPASLLDSQLATLEPLGADEDGVVLDFSLTPQQLVDAAVEALGLPRA